MVLLAVHSNKKIRKAWRPVKGTRVCGLLYPETETCLKIPHLHVSNEIRCTMPKNVNILKPHDPTKFNFYKFTWFHHSGEHAQSRLFSKEAKTKIPILLTSLPLPHSESWEKLGCHFLHSHNLCVWLGIDIRRIQEMWCWSLWDFQSRDSFTTEIFQILGLDCRIPRSSFASNWIL